MYHKISAKCRHLFVRLNTYFFYTVFPTSDKSQKSLSIYICTLNLYLSKNPVTTCSTSSSSCLAFFLLPSSISPLPGTGLHLPPRRHHPKPPPHHHTITPTLFATAVCLQKHVWGCTWTKERVRFAEVWVHLCACACVCVRCWHLRTRG